MNRYYSFRDTLENSYSSPFVASSDSDAKRRAYAMSQKSDSLLGMFNGDYELWFVGEFSEINMFIAVSPVNLGRVNSFVPNKEVVSDSSSG